jgi:hypothetical protein
MALTCSRSQLTQRAGARSSAAEHLTFNQRADGSIPSGLTQRKKPNRTSSCACVFLHAIRSGMAANTAEAKYSYPILLYIQRLAVDLPLKQTALVIH